jgi:uncharacterized protein
MASEQSKKLNIGVRMSRTRVVISTQHASRYLQQLAKHWAHKFETEFTSTSATIALPLGIARLAASDISLLVELTAHISEDGPLLMEIVQEHIARFAFRETLEFDWETVT